MIEHESKQDEYQEQEYQGIPQDDIEEIHVYMWKKEPHQPFLSNWRQWDTSRFVHALVQLLALSMLAFFWLIPGQAIYTTQIMTVPALFLPVQQVRASVAITPTGNKTIQAVKAHGILTIYNGSFIAQQLPANFVLSTANGREVATDQAVVIPGANLPTLGETSVSAHAIHPGTGGNIAPYALQATYGSAVSIKNLTAFTGGQDAYSEHYTTSQDKAKALNSARTQVQDEQLKQSHRGLLVKPCSEKDTQSQSSVSVTLACLYATFKAPAHVQILFVRIQGNTVILTIQSVLQPS